MSEENETPDAPELPAQFMDPDTGSIRMPDLVKSYGELAAFKLTHDEQMAKLPQKAEDYKIALKLPDDVKLPEGMQLTIDEKDPRAPELRAFALKHRLSQDAVDELVALEAQHQITSNAAADQEFAGEVKALGPKAAERQRAVSAALKEHLAADEFEAVRSVVTSAAAVSGLEKLLVMAKGNRLTPPPARPADIPPEQRWYGKKNGAAHR